MAKQNSALSRTLKPRSPANRWRTSKYRYFAKLAREAGAEDVAKIFEETAEQELMHAFGHLDLLYPKAQLTPTKALEIAIKSETCEYTEMYPKFRHLAVEEDHQAAVAEFDEQIAESKEHADAFCRTLDIVAKSHFPAALVLTPTSCCPLWVC